MHKKKKLLGLIILGALLVAGVVYFFWPGGTGEPEALDYAGDVLEDGDINKGPIDLVKASEAPSEEKQTQTPATDVADQTKSTGTAQPTPRTELEGTDPDTVNLASGNFQLVELFAFW